MLFGIYYWLLSVGNGFLCCQCKILRILYTFALTVPLLYGKVIEDAVY